MPEAPMKGKDGKKRIGALRSEVEGLEAHVKEKDAEALKKTATELILLLESAEADLESVADEYPVPPEVVDKINRLEAAKNQLTDLLSRHESVKAEPPAVDPAKLASIFGISQKQAEQNAGTPKVGEAGEVSTDTPEVSTQDVGIAKLARVFGITPEQAGKKIVPVKPAEPEPITATVAGGGPESVQAQLPAETAPAPVSAAPSPPPTDTARPAPTPSAGQTAPDVVRTAVPFTPEQKETAMLAFFDALEIVADDSIYGGYGVKHADGTVVSAEYFARRIESGTFGTSALQNIGVSSGDVANRFRTFLQAKVAELRRAAEVATRLDTVRSAGTTIRPPALDLPLHGDSDEPRAEEVPIEGPVELGVPAPEREPIKMPLDLLIELIGSDKLKNIMGMFAQERDEAEIKNVLAKVFDADLDAAQKERVENQLRRLGFSSLEEFRTQWKGEMHERVLAGLQGILKYQIEQAVISDPELQKLEQQGTTKQRILRGIWNAIPAAGAGATVAAGLFTAGVGSVVAIGAAGAAAKIMGRFFRKGNQRAEQERRAENEQAINRLRENVSKKVKQQMLERAAADGDLTMAAAISTVLREPTGDQTGNDEMIQLRRQSEMTQLITAAALERANASGSAQDQETAINKQLDSLVAGMRLENEKARQENAVPALIEQQSFWTKIMEEVKKAGSTRDLWLHDEKFWKQAAGFAVEGAAGFAAGAAIGWAGGDSILRGLARGAVGLTSGAGEQALRDKSREMTRTEKLNSFLEKLRGKNEEVAEALRQRLNTILPKEMSTREKWFSALKGGAKRAAWVVGLGTLFDVGRDEWQEYMKGITEERTAAGKNLLDVLPKEVLATGRSHEASVPTVATELTPEQFKIKFGYLTVGKGEGLSHAATRDFLYNDQVRGVYMKNVADLRGMDNAQLDKIEQALRDHNGDFAALEKSDDLSRADMRVLRSAAKVISEHNEFSGKEGELRVRNADKLMTVFDSKSGQHKIVALDSKGVPTSQVDWAKELYGAEVKQEQITIANGIPVTGEGADVSPLPEASMVESVTAVEGGKTHTVNLKNGQSIEGLTLDSESGRLIANSGTKFTGGGGGNVAEVVVGSKEIVTSKPVTTDDVPVEAKFSSDAVMKTAMQGYGGGGVVEAPSEGASSTVLPEQGEAVAPAGAVTEITPVDTSAGQVELRGDALKQYQSTLNTFRVKWTVENLVNSIGDLDQAIVIAKSINYKLSAIAATDHLNVSSKVGNLLAADSIDQTILRQAIHEDLGRDSSIFSADEEVFLSQLAGDRSITTVDGAHAFKGSLGGRSTFVAFPADKDITFTQVEDQVIAHKGEMSAQVKALEDGGFEASGIFKIGKVSKDVIATSGV